MKFEHKISRDIFTLFSILNVTGYNDENNVRGMHPVRVKVRKFFKNNHYGSKYQEFSGILKKYHPFYLINFLLKYGEIRPKKYQFLYEEFSNEKNIGKLWETDKNYIEKETLKIFSLFKNETKQLIRFVNGKQSIKKLVLITNPLDAYWRGYSIKIKDTCYIIVGPGATDNNNELMRHELLHILSPNIKIPQNFLIPDKNLIKQGYGDKKIMNYEYVIRSLSLIYKREILGKKITNDVKRERKNFYHIKDVMEFVNKQIKKG